MCKCLVMTFQFNLMASGPLRVKGYQPIAHLISIYQKTEMNKKLWEKHCQHNDPLAFTSLLDWNYH